MNGTIYLLNDEQELVELREHPYDSEALLQTLLQDHPSVLAGDQLKGSEDRRWLLVRREASIPSEQHGSGRFLLDHLFLDQDGVPTLVEVKRSTDTRIRREVIGQMLDYAANAVTYWSIDRLVTDFEETCREREVEAADVLAEHLGEDIEAHTYWQDVKTNLEAGRIRMIFVADVIPTELQRIVEFLNEQMDPAEVVAIEIKQYLGGPLRTLVPRVVGQTARAQQKKRTPPTQSRSWDETSFFSVLAETTPTPDVAVARRIISWARERGLEISYGNGTKNGAARVRMPTAQGTVTACVLWTYNRLSLEFGYLMKHPPFETEEQRRALADRFERIDNRIEIPDNRLSKRPYVDLEVLRDDDKIASFLAALGWCAEVLDKHA